MRKAEKLLQQDKVDLLTGTVNSGSTLAVGQVAERNDRILVTTVSYAPSITGAQCNPNVFRVNANAFMQSNALTDWLIKNVSGKRYFFIGPDYEMGRSTIAAFQDDIKRLGGTDVGATYPPLGAKDFTPYVGQIRAARPDVIMTATAGNDTVRLLTQLKEYGILTDKLTLAGAAGAVTQENIGAMGGAGGRLPERRRLFDRHRHAGEQEIRRRLQEGIPERSRPVRGGHLRPVLSVQAGHREGRQHRDRQGARRDGGRELGDSARHEEDAQGRPPGDRRHGRRQGEGQRLPDRRQGAGRRSRRPRQVREVLIGSDRPQPIRWKIFSPICTSWCCPRSSTR